MQQISLNLGDHKGHLPTMVLLALPQGVVSSGTAPPEFLVAEASRAAFGTHQTIGLLDSLWAAPQGARMAVGSKWCACEVLPGKVGCGCSVGTEKPWATQRRCRWQNMAVAFAAWRGVAKWRKTPSAWDCRPDGATLARRGSQECVGWRARPPQLRAGKPSTGVSQRHVDAGARVRCPPAEQCQID